MGDAEETAEEEKEFSEEEIDFRLCLLALV